MYKKFLNVFLIILIIQSFTNILNITQVFGQSSLKITLKWRAKAGTGSTWTGPLAADLNNDGLMEIVITGMNGIAALSPLNGSVIWRQPYGGDHVPCEIIDLNRDGIPEILMGPQYINGSSGGVLALHGNNGSVYWYNKNAACKGTYIAVADINADGRPEIYTATPGRITALTYDGRIFASTYTYYPCWGGMTIGDTDFDSVFEVYLGERSNTYPPPTSPGRGIRAFWADNLSEIWCDPDILCSSQAPELADVDKDGDLEIIILHQRGGVAVYNTDGSVNTYNNIYRKQLRVSGFSNGHQNPTVADVDDDGNLELIQCGDASHNAYPPVIFDLVNWKIDAKLPFPSIDPPTAADLDYDGKLEIIAPNAKNVTIFKYNPTTINYDIIYTIPLSNANPFSIAQDIDGDGKLELVFNQFNSWISVYDVDPMPAPTPLPRSGRYFYSEYRTREAVYVPPPDQPPKISKISPSDGATNVPATLSQISFKLIDAQGDLMNYTVTTNPNIGLASGINVPSGTIITVPVSGLAPSKTYTWTVTVTDGNHTTKRTFKFYTEGNVTLTLNISPEGSEQYCSVIKTPDNIGNIYAYGTRVKLTAVADNIVYKFSRWDGDLKWMGSNNPATILMDGNKTVTAKFTKIEYTLTISISPMGCGSVNVNKTKPYYYGDVVNLTATPNVGWSFSQWENDLTGSQNPATIIIDGNKRVTAVFTQDQYTLTITVIGNGNVTTDPYKTTYVYGENVTLTATPDPEWTFAGWSGDVSSSENPITVMMDSNKFIIANFTSANYHILTIIKIGNGTVNKNPDYAVYAHDENVTLTAIPDAGWKFVEWSGDLTGNDNPVTITMNSSKVVTATFTPLQYTLILSVNGSGQIIKTPDQETYTYGTVVTLEAVPDLGWIFTGWGGDLNETTSPTTIIITSNKTISATFTQQEYTILIHVEPPEGGSVNVNPEGPYHYGDTVQFEAVPTSGWYFAGWSGDISGSTSPTNITVNGDMNITASFIKIGYTLTVDVIGNGSVVISPEQLIYDPGTEVTLTANPALGWSFNGWSGDISSSTNPITITMTSNKTVTATFMQDQYMLTVNVKGGGLVAKKPCQETYTYGTVVQLTATPDPGFVFSHWEGDISGNQSTTYITVTGNLTITAVFVEAPLNWWDIAWKYRRTITINHTKVSGNLTDFPVLIEITDSSLAEKAQPDGDDFVFTDANNMKLDHQIEYYNSTTGHLIAWVKVPRLSSTTDIVLYMYYGNPESENQQNPTGVWDANYKLVLHLNEETGILRDSTINGNNGTPFGNLIQGATGYIGGCIEFNGGYIQLPRIFTNETQFTFSAWIYPRSGARYFISQYKSSYQGAFLQVYADNRIELYVNNIIVAKPITINKWYYVVATFDGTTAQLYVNDNPPVSKIASTPIWASSNMYIGDRYDHVRKFYGFIDEVRVSNISRSAAWILTEYNNQLNPAAFYSIGTEETFGELTASGNQSTIATLTTYGYAAVEYACQRKTFYANGRFWVFYYDGAKSAGYSTSTDGLLWTPFTPFTSKACGAGWRFAVTFDGTCLHYVFSTGKNGDPLYYRCGIPNADGTITWLDVEQNITIGEGNTGHLWPSIAIDSEGRPWVAYARKNATENSRYAYVTMSITSNGTWITAPGFPHQLSPTNYTGINVMIVPLTNQKMLAIVSCGGWQIESYLWNGSSWSEKQTTTSAITSDGIIECGLSAVSQGDDVHLVFVKDSTHDLIYTKCSYDSNSWGPEILVQSGVTSETSPVLSIDLATNKLYCFWAGSPATNCIYYKVYNGSTWNFVEGSNPWIIESSLAGYYKYDGLSGFYQSYNNQIGLAYTIGTGNTYLLKFAFLNTSTH